uniref:Protein kinase domain-containing protein n=1 Tax=Accipiter nisus TaxID=211598 RepID=A0A8B9MQ66_9AVES
PLRGARGRASAGSRVGSGSGGCLREAGSGGGRRGRARAPFKGPAGSRETCEELSGYRPGGAQGLGREPPSGRRGRGASSGMEQAAPKSKLKKLSEDSLTKQPEEVFDVLEKLGEGSYGSVFKAIHKESGQVVAIKQVPVESDLQEIIKEISIMQQCDR